MFYAVEGKLYVTYVFRKMYATKKTRSELGCHYAHRFFDKTVSTTSILSANYDLRSCRNKEVMRNLWNSSKVRVGVVSGRNRSLLAKFVNGCDFNGQLPWITSIGGSYFPVR